MRDLERRLERLEAHFQREKCTCRELVVVTAADWNAPNRLQLASCLVHLGAPSRYVVLPLGAERL